MEKHMDACFYTSLSRIFFPSQKQIYLQGNCCKTLSNYCQENNLNS